jgi:aconitate decarboxylase
MNHLTRSLAHYVANPTFGGAKEQAYVIAKLGFVDTVGTMMAGAFEPVVQMLLTHYSAYQAPQESPVVFAGLFKPSPIAACINATAGHALDYDDVAMAGHPSTVLVPAILAEGYYLGVSGEQALQAYVVGYEVWSELIFREPGKYHLKGWHPTGVLGTVAVAAAVSVLHRLNEEQATKALAIAASMASGLVANFGTMTKPFHAGRAAGNGIEAVRLAKLGLTAAPDVFEHPAGYLNALSVKEDADRTSMADRLGQRPRLLETGLSIKRYPICYSSHRAVDGMLALVAEHDLNPAAVAQVAVTLGPAQASMLRNHRPQTGLEAKFSIEFAMASALVEREVGLSQLSDTFVQRPDVQELFERVSVQINHKQCPLEPTFAFSDRVVVTLHDGRTLDSGDIRFPLGNAGNPLDGLGMKAKFLDCLESAKAQGVKSGVCAETLYDRLFHLESIDTIQTLFDHREQSPT